jgi:hypothetical protein
LWTPYEYSTGIVDGVKKAKIWNDYEGGTSYNDTGIGTNLGFGGGDTRPLRQVMGEEPGSDQFHLIAGLLNATYFEARATPTEYFMTVQQFWYLFNNPTQVPDAYISLRDLIEANYHETPGSGCDITIGG